MQIFDSFKKKKKKKKTCKKLCLKKQNYLLPQSHDNLLVDITREGIRCKTTLQLLLSNINKLIVELQEITNG